MKLKGEKPISSVILYVAAAITFILGAGLLIINIRLYYTNVTQYVAQGYSAATVANQLIQSQLIPGVFEPIGVYWGISLLLLGAGIINQKVLKCLAVSTENGIPEDPVYVTAQKPAEKVAEETVEVTAEKIEDKKTTEERTSGVEENK